jgi:hypothetical protein
VIAVSAAWFGFADADLLQGARRFLAPQVAASQQRLCLRRSACPILVSPAGRLSIMGVIFVGGLDIVAFGVSASGNSAICVFCLIF